MTVGRIVYQFPPASHTRLRLLFAPRPGPALPDPLPYAVANSGIYSASVELSRLSARDLADLLAALRGEPGV